MATTWGDWDYAGGNGMRVGIDATAEAISHTETQCTFTIKIYTDNQYTYADNGEVLNYGYDISGTKTFNNQNGSSAVLRDTKTYNYNYSSSSYGSSPGTAKFSARVSNTYNGVTPRHEVTIAIPARPYGAPAPPSACTATRVSDTSVTVAWTRHATTGEPYSALWLERLDYGTGTWVRIATLAGTVVTYSDTTAVANKKYAYRVQADNTVGTSAFAQAPDVYTSPATPTSPLRTQSGTDQVLTWALAVGYTEYQTEVWRAVNGVWALLTTVASGITTFTDTTSSAASKNKYRFRTKTTIGTVLYSADSAETTETAGVTSAPSAPISLQPAAKTLDPTAPIVFTWLHQPTDGSSQSAFQVQYRYVGSGTWIQTGKIVSTASSWTMPANTVAKGNQVEWQVQTWGANAAAGPFSATATWTTSPVVAVRYPLFLDVSSGQTVADSTARLLQQADVSGTWGTAPLDVFGTTDAKYGQEVYLDSSGKLRVRPDYASASAAGLILLNADPITRYPIGVSHHGISQAHAAANGWPYGLSCGLMTLRQHDNNGYQLWFETTPAATRMLHRVFANSAWGAWKRIDGTDGKLIQSGIVNITPVANTPTKQTGGKIVFPVAFTAIPIMTLGLNSAVPGTTVTGIAFANLTATDFDIYITRTNTTATDIHWMAIGVPV